MVIRTRKGTQLWHGPFSKNERLGHARWKAQQASDYLSAALGFRIAVRPAIAVYGPVLPWDIATVRDVDVFSGPRLRKYLVVAHGRPGYPSLPRSKSTQSMTQRLGSCRKSRCGLVP